MFDTDSNSAATALLAIQACADPEREPRQIQSDYVPS